MITDKRAAGAVVLLQRRARGRGHAAGFLAEHGDPVEALRALSGADQRPLIPDVSGDAEHLDAAIDAVCAELETLESEGVGAITVLDDDYPHNLRLVYDRPLVLWVRGSLSDADSRSVAVVGTREASEQGLGRAREIAGELVASGYVVVSGLAEGIDTAAHLGTLEAGGRTIAVIGTGHRHAFPPANEPLQRRLATESAVVSPFPPDQGPRRWTFPARNAVMSGIARATVVVEATHTSGAKMQARLALEHGRQVVLVDSLLEHAWARDYATRPGVHVVGDVAEVIDLLDRLYAPNLTLSA